MRRLMFELRVIRGFFGWLLWEAVDWIAPFPSAPSRALLPYAGEWWLSDECRRCRTWEFTKEVRHG